MPIITPPDGKYMNTGYFESVVNYHFKAIDDGTKVFYPQGTLGRSGFIVSSPELEETLRQRLSRFYVAVLVSSGPLVVTPAPLAKDLHFSQFALLLMTITILAWAGIRLYFFPVTRQMETAREANSSPAAWAAAGQTLHPRMIGLSLALCLLLVEGALAMYHSTSDSRLLLVAVMFTVAFGPWALAARRYAQSRNTGR